MSSLKLLGGLMAITMYSAAYAENTLCEKNEIAVWSCETKKKTFSLCASSDIGADSGYMQYRAGHRGRIGFRYPEALRHPRGVFKLEYLARDGRFTFSNKGYEYEITDLLIGPTEINISKNNRQVAQIDCSRADPSILDTSSIDLFKSAGVSE